MSSPGTFYGIEIARSGLAAHQKSLQVTGHNISNANTPGYSRQEAVHTAGNPYPAPGASSGTAAGQLGSGVEISEIRRIRNEYLDTQVRDSTSAQSYWESKTEIMEQIESIFPEPDGRGIQEVMLNFISDWQDLNNAPQDDGIKSAVVESGKELARLFRDTHNQLNNVDKSIISNIDTGTGLVQGGKIYDMAQQVNDLATRLKDITESIIKVKREGHQPNDLLDKRDALLEELSQFGPVKVQGILDGQGAETGGINISLFGKSLIHTDANLKVNQEEVKVTYNDQGDNNKLNDDVIVNIGSNVVNLTDRIDNGTGKMVGTVSAWSDNNKFMHELNGMARSMGDAVNALYDPADENLPQYYWVFEDTNGSQITGNDRNAGQIYVQQDLIDTPENLDGTEALGVARLRNKTQVLTGREENMGSGWNLSITADNEASILEGFTFTFKSDTTSAISTSFNEGTKTLEIEADWDNSDGHAPTLADIETAINQAFSDKGYSATISLSVDGGNYSAGDIDNATSSASFDIKLQDNLNLGGSTLEESYQGYIASLGSKTKSAQNMSQNQQAILDQITSLQQSASGVSLDEELSRMIQFQYGYQASARVMNVMDGILDTLINRMAV